MEFFATCPAGFEQLLSQELRGLHTPHVRPLKGQVAFEGTLADAYRVCLWSRLASRVIAVIARGGARDANELYDTACNVAWEEQFAPGATFSINARGTNAQLRNTQFVALRTKDAILDRMLARTGARPTANVTSPDLFIEVRISRERATIGIDLSGEPLFRRGYEAVRGAKSPLPSLRPDYAAALLAMSGWGKACRDENPTVVVPFSGSGTLAVEAALQASKRAPGLLRTKWGFAGWALHDQEAWSEQLGQARQDARQDCPARLILSDTRAGYDIAARQALRAAGIDALDTVYSNLNDMETFRKEVELIKTLGFDGKSIINPRQIEVVNEVFAPKPKEIEKAQTIIAAIKEAERRGSGVIAVNGKMVDRPVVLRAQRTIDLAIASGILKEEDIV